MSRPHFPPSELKDAGRCKRYASGVQKALGTHLGKSHRVPPRRSPRNMGKLSAKGKLVLESRRRIQAAGQGSGGLVRKGPKHYRRGRAWRNGKLQRPERFKVKS